MVITGSDSPPPISAPLPASLCCYPPLPLVAHDFQDRALPSRVRRRFALYDGFGPIQGPRCL